MKELMRSWTPLYYITGKQMDTTMFEHTQISHLQCGQRYPSPCLHCPLCWAAIQNGSGTSQTQQVSAILCQNVLLEHNEHMMWHSIMVMRYITYALAVDCTGLVPASLGFWYFCEVVIPVAVTCGQHSLMNKFQTKKTTLSQKGSVKAQKKKKH